MYADCKTCLGVTLAGSILNVHIQQTLLLLGFLKRLTPDREQTPRVEASTHPHTLLHFLCPAATSTPPQPARVLHPRLNRIARAVCVQTTNPQGRFQQAGP